MEGTGWTEYTGQICRVLDGWKEINGWKELDGYGKTVWMERT